MRFLCVLALLFSTATAFAADPSADLFVAPAGNDVWSGRLAAPNADRTDGPLATIDAARLRVRELRKQQPDRRDPVRVLLRGGFYPLASTIAFTAEDSGVGAASPTIYQAYPDETPILSGGVILTGWKVAADGRWSLTIDDVKSGRWNFSQLFVNGHRRMRPRAPKDGYFHIASRVESGEARSGRAGDDRFRFTAGDIRHDWKDLSDVEVISFHPWFTSMLRIKQVDVDSRTVSFTGHTRTSAPFGQLSAGMRYLVENVAEALDEPGEWYLDRPTGVLTYIPMPGETPENATVIAPKLEKLISLETPAGRTQIESLVVKGLTFAHTNWVTPPDGSSISQAAVAVNASVSLGNVRLSEIRECTFTQQGTYGLELGSDCSDIIVAGCRFIDLGTGGIKIGSTSIPARPSKPANLIYVRDNLFAHLGRIHPAAVGIWIGHAAYIFIEHNDIYDLYYTGISTGWTWGYRPTINKGIRITNNHIHHIGQSVLSDMAGIYTLGASPETVLEHNRIHDIARDKYGGWGIYYDEGSSGYIARNNLLYRLQDGGFHQHYGEDNRFENNIILESGEVAWGPTRLDSSQSPGQLREKPAFYFERNIISGWGAASVVRPEAAGKLFMDNPHLLKVDRNLYWNGGAEPKFKHLSLADWRKLGHDLNSVVGEIKLPSPDDVDFRVPDTSAAQIGFVPFDISKSGRQTREPPDLDPKRWPRWFPPSTGGPKRIADDFEATPVGAVAEFARTSEEPPTATLRVTDAVAFEGKRSLKFADAGKLQAAYNPHLYWSPNYRTGVATARFALRSDGAAISHEWRGAGHPYATGPAIYLSASGRLRVGSKDLTTIPRGTWFTVEITCPLDKRAGKYDVRISLPDGTMKEAKDVACSPDFRELSWFGFSAVGDAGEAYLDALSLEVK